MNASEFSEEFDILYNNISSNSAPGLDDYEKSVFLNKAQDKIIADIYSGRNNSGLSFEETEEARRYLDALVKSVILTESTDTEISLSSNSYHFELPEDVLFITYESVAFDKKEVPCMENKFATVVPTTLDRFSRTIDNPFKGPSKKRVLRLDTGIGDNLKSKVELVSKYKITSYIVRYIKKPKKIDLSTTGEATVVCEVSPKLHKAILEEAVRMALQTMYRQTNQQ